MPGFSSSISTTPPQSDVPTQPSDHRGTFPATATRTLTYEYWGLDLREYLPCVLSHDGVEASAGDVGRVRDFLGGEFATLTEEGLGHLRASADVHASAKRRYLQLNCDIIELRHNDRTVGVVIGEPEDWSTYYIRTLAVVQEYQRPALIRRFVRECLEKHLRAHHVERVTADTSPANVAMTRFFAEFHFHATGHQLSERWGPMVRYTKFLDPHCEAAFHVRFGGAAPPGSNGKRKETAP